MTPDTWDRRNISHVPGWNNAAVAVPPANDFDVAYDAGTDVLTFTSATGSFTEFAANMAGTTCAVLELAGLHSASGAWVAALNAYDMTTVSANSATLASARTFLGILAGDTLTIQSVGVGSANCAPSTITASWDGSVVLPAI